MPYATYDLLIKGRQKNLLNFLKAIVRIKD